MTELNKIRIEKQLQTLDAVLSAIVLSKKWLQKYYPETYLDRVEEQSIQELLTHLNKGEQVIRNYVHTLLPLKDE